MYLWLCLQSAKQSILKEINPENSLEGLMAEAEAPILWLPDVKNQLIWKDPDAGKEWGHEDKGATEDELVGWHHQLNGHEFEQTLGDSEGQGSLAGYSPWGRKESDTTEQLNNSNWVQGVLRISSDDIMENQAFRQAWVWIPTLLFVTCVVVLIIDVKWLPP